MPPTQKPTFTLNSKFLPIIFPGMKQFVTTGVGIDKLPINSQIDSTTSMGIEWASISEPVPDSNKPEVRDD
jgi:hypothetical protein